ncbi:MULTISPECIES: NUDIX hydrolase [Streptomyces]|jgi:8-oxo-dGTP pyrophosphatase MutT (NUDIX family)|uniref:NUDIX hydrolase n=1 Tax=Streptomyces TaxID=1883 RepID=UPI000A3CE80E|nr:NUDIX hydrolase [Streptomyces glaucescens]
MTTGWMPREEWVKTQPRALVASCVLISDGRGRLLVLRYSPAEPNAGHWWLPGGMLDPGEDPWTAARREALEETGVDIGNEARLIGIDHRADVLGTGPVLDCYFDGGVLDGTERIRLSPEHDRYAFLTLDELTEPTLTVHRPILTALHAAARSGSVVCLREGRPW